jgi:hypothetical protein
VHGSPEEPTLVTSGALRTGDAPPVAVRRDSLQRLRRIALHPVPVGFALMVLGWPTTQLAPQGGIDRSWQAILALSQATYHFAWGPRLVFTFGPLAFLNYPALYSFGTGLAAFTYLAILRWTLFSTVYWALRQSFADYLSIPIAYAVGVSVAVFAQPELLDGIVFVWAVAVVRGTVSGRAQRWLLPASGAVCALSLLEKSNVGAIALVQCVVVIAALSVSSSSAFGSRTRAAHAAGRSTGSPASSDPRGSRGPTSTRLARFGVQLAVFFSSFAATFLVGWVATGNAIGAIPSWVSGAVEVAAGYSSAMQIETPGSGADYWRALVVAAVVMVLLVRNARRDLRRGSPAWAVPLLAVVVLFGGFKEGFVRHNLHSLVFFFLAVLVVAGLACVPRDRVIVAVGLGLTALFVFQSAGAVPPATFDPSASVRNAGSDVAHLAVTSKRVALERSARAAMRRAYAAEGLTSRLVSPLDGRTVLVDPWTESVAWAYPKIRLDPLPVLGEYSAYTPVLDQKDRQFVISARGPKDILRQAIPGLDNRYPYFESPAEQLAMACRYRQRAVSGGWALLSRSKNRCGPAVPLGEVRLSRATGTVTVPRAPSGDDAVVAVLDLSPPWWNSLLATLYKPPPMYIVVNGNLTYRFVPSTAPDPHLLRPPADLGYTGAFAPVTFDTFRLSGTDVATWHLDVRFMAIPVRP